MPSVSRTIALALGLPERGIRFGLHLAVAAGVHVPETAMNEDHLAESGEDQVRFARQILAVQPEPIAHGVNHPANGQLRLCIAALDRRHTAAALLWCQDIGHEPCSSSGVACAILLR